MGSEPTEAQAGRIIDLVLRHNSQAVETEAGQLRFIAEKAKAAWDEEKDHRVGKLLRAMVDVDFRKTYLPELFANANAKAEPQPPTKAEIAERLHQLSKTMLDIATDMDYYGGLAEWAQHGKELAGASGIVMGWAKAIADEPPQTQGKPQ